MDDLTISVEVVYARAGQLIRCRVELLSGSSVMDAIEASGMREALPASEIDPSRLGILSRKVHPDTLVHQGDRIEIYRPLLLDPMEARRRRAG